MAGMIAGLATAAMNCSGMALTVMDKSELILGLSEGLLVFGATVLLNYLFQMASELGKCFSVQGTAAQDCIRLRCHPGCAVWDMLHSGGVG